MVPKIVSESPPSVRNSLAVPIALGAFERIEEIDIEMKRNKVEEETEWGPTVTVTVTNPGTPTLAGSVQMI